MVLKWTQSGAHSERYEAEAEFLVTPDPGDLQAGFPEEISESDNDVSQNTCTRVSLSNNNSKTVEG